MKIVDHNALPVEQFPGGATYQTMVGDDDGSTPVRCGIQTSPPGYATPNHSHPYVEIITVLEGEAEGWSEDRDGVVPLKPGMTLIMPPNQRHGFRVVGDTPFKTYGIHASPERIVEVHD